MLAVLLLLSIVVCRFRDMGNLVIGELPPSGKIGEDIFFLFSSFVILVLVIVVAFRKVNLLIIKSLSC